MMNPLTYPLYCLFVVKYSRYDTFVIKIFTKKNTSSQKKYMNTLKVFKNVSRRSFKYVASEVPKFSELDILKSITMKYNWSAR